MFYVNILLLVSLLAYGTRALHNSWYAGKPKNGDIPIFKTNHVLYGLPFLIRTSNLKYPDDPSLELFVITSIYAKDNDQTGNGAHASIVSGGLGYTKVEIKFKSKRSYGVDYTIIIFGRWLYLRGSEEETHIVNKLRLPNRIDAKGDDDDDVSTQPRFRLKPLKPYRVGFPSEQWNLTSSWELRDPMEVIRD